MFVDEVMWVSLTPPVLCDSWVTRTASCPVNCRPRCSRSWRRGRTSWATWTQTDAEVSARQTDRLSVSSHLSLYNLESFSLESLSRSAGWPELSGVGGLRAVLRGAGGPLPAPHGGVVQREQGAAARQFPQVAPVPGGPPVPAALHGHSDVCGLHSGQGAAQRGRKRWPIDQFCAYLKKKKVSPLTTLYENSYQDAQ